MNYLKKITLLLMFFLMISTNLYASVETDVEDLMSNRVHTFDTQGHPKAKGVRLTIPYPQSWVAKEGERPNVVQKFQKIENNKIISTAIHILEVPENEKYTPEQIKSEKFRKGNIEKLGDDFKYIKSGKTKIENLDTIWTNYIQQFNMPSVNISMYCLAYTFYFSKRHITILYAVSGKADDTDLSQKFNEYFPLFEIMATKIIIPEQWNIKNYNQ